LRLKSIQSTYVYGADPTLQLWYVLSPLQAQFPAKPPFPPYSVCLPSVGRFVAVVFEKKRFDKRNVAQSFDGTGTCYMESSNERKHLRYSGLNKLLSSRLVPFLPIPLQFGIVKDSKRLRRAYMSLTSKGFCGTSGNSPMENRPKQSIPSGD
jgi:hypothetical protein